MKCIDRSLFSDDLEVMMLLEFRDDGFYYLTHLHTARVGECLLRRKERTANECDNE